MSFFTFFFVIPFFILSYVNVGGTAFNVLAIWFFIGTLGMYSLEIVAMKVEGFKKYFTEGWNYMDTFAFIFSITFLVVLIKIRQSDQDTEDLESILKLLKGFILLAIWVKLTWFQKLFKDFGLM